METIAVLIQPYFGTPSEKHIAPSTLSFWYCAHDNHNTKHAERNLPCHQLKPSNEPCHCRPQPIFFFYCRLAFLTKFLNFMHNMFQKRLMMGTSRLAFVVLRIQIATIRVNIKISDDFGFVDFSPKKKLTATLHQD